MGLPPTPCLLRYLPLNFRTNMPSNWLINLQSDSLDARTNGTGMTWHMRYHCCLTRTKRYKKRSAQDFASYKLQLDGLGVPCSVDIIIVSREVVLVIFSTAWHRIPSGVSRDNIRSI